MGVFGTSKHEEAELRAAAAQPLESLGSILTLSHYETASEFSSLDPENDHFNVNQDEITKENIPGTNAESSTEQSSQSDNTVHPIDSSNMHAMHLDSEGVNGENGENPENGEIDDDDNGYLVQGPEPTVDPTAMTENALNRIMTSHSVQSEALLRSVTRSRTHNGIIDPVDLDWDGPLDPENPNNWPVWKKWFVTLAVAYTCLCISLGLSLYVEGVGEIMVKMDISQTLGLSGLTFYLIGLALGPVFAAPLSEMIGRRNIYITTFPVSMLFTMGVGLSQNIRSILVLRFFAGLVASPPMSIAGGTVSDIWGNSLLDMAIAMALFCVAPFLGPIIGPIVGGFAAESEGWRFTMWTSLIFSAVSLPLLFFSPETFKLAILKKRAHARGIRLVRPEYNMLFFLEMLQTNLVRPVEMLFVEPIVGLTSIYIAFIFGVLFGFFEAFPIVFRGVYLMDLGVSGLPFIGVGLGLIFGVVLYVVMAVMGARKSKKELEEKQRQAGTDEKIEEVWEPPEKKLMSAAVGAVFLPISLFWLAWTSRESVHWIAPTLSGLPFGFGLIWVFFGVVLYYSMSFPPDYVASALAANNFLRYIVASVFPLFIVQMYDRLHIDWATSLLAFISLIMVPIPLAFMRYGGKLRQHSKYGYVAYFRKQKEKAAAQKHIVIVPSSDLVSENVSLVSIDQALEALDRDAAAEKV